MSLTYQAIGWNRTKRVYDGVLSAGLGLYLAAFVGIGAVVHPNATAETLVIRALGTAALLLLHVILAIGPLCRLDRRFLPLLYNRRHLGVTMFFLALGHGAFSLIQFHALGNVNAIVSLVTSNPRYGSLADFPFQTLGFFALLILFLMAATSHDFWLHTLGAPVWKRLHMLVYLAYGLLVAHVALGALQSETRPALALLLGAGMTAIIALHLAAGVRENRKEAAVCKLDDIPEGRARVVSHGGERIAVFKHRGRVCAIGNVCQHQGGPLGEGKIIDGCVTCPWHGYQYLPETGAAPPPFTEKVPTYRAKIADGHVFIDPRPIP